MNWCDHYSVINKLSVGKCCGVIGRRHVTEVTIGRRCGGSCIASRIRTLSFKVVVSLTFGSKRGTSSIPTPAKKEDHSSTSYNHYKTRDNSSNKAYNESGAVWLRIDNTNKRSYLPRVFNDDACVRNLGIIDGNGAIFVAASLFSIQFSLVSGVFNAENSSAKRNIVPGMDN